MQGLYVRFLCWWEVQAFYVNLPSQKYIDGLHSQDGKYMFIFRTNLETPKPVIYSLTRWTQGDAILF